MFVVTSPFRGYQKVLPCDIMFDLITENLNFGVSFEWLIIRTLIFHMSVLPVGTLIRSCDLGV
jgi:hypothetical protein